MLTARGQTRDQLVSILKHCRSDGELTRLSSVEHTDGGGRRRGGPNCVASSPCSREAVGQATAARGVMLGQIYLSRPTTTNGLWEIQNGADWVSIFLVSPWKTDFAEEEATAGEREGLYPTSSSPPVPPPCPCDKKSVHDVTRDGAIYVTSLKHMYPAACCCRSNILLLSSLRD